MPAKCSAVQQGTANQPGPSVPNAAPPPDAGPAALFPDLPRGRGPSPVHRWNPAWCGAIDMRIARDGTWYYMGSPIGRLPLVKLFAGVLRREDDGSYVMVTPGERVGIKVDDAPFVAVEVRRQGQGRDQILAFRTNVDDLVTADADHPIRVAAAANGEPSPYVLVRPGLEALIGRAVFYQLVDWAEERDGALGVWSAGTFFPLGRADV